MQCRNLTDILDTNLSRSRTACDGSFPHTLSLSFCPFPCLLASLPPCLLADGEAIMSPSSTWCCNPQFRITVRKAGEVVICLGQVDPRVENRR